MDLVSFVVLEARSLEFGRLCAPSRSPEERALVWYGLPPPAVADESGLARIAVQGVCDGRRVYVETVPNGLRLSALPLPEDLAPYVVGHVLQALAALHRSQQVHGNVTPEDVWLGLDGSVRLSGRGRQGAVPQHDLLAAASLLQSERTVPGRDCEEAAHEVLSQSEDGDAERLGALVSEHKTDVDVSGEEWLIINLDDHTLDGGFDEISPDLGPDEGHDGIMDRWSVNSTTDVTTTGSGGNTTEMTDNGRGNALSLELWSRLAAPPQPASASRFNAVKGQSSRGIRGLLAEEVPDVLPAPVEARLGSIVVTDTDTGTSVTSTGHFGSALAEPEYIRDTRGDPDQTVRSAAPVEPVPGVPVWQLVIAALIGGLAVFSLMRALG